MTAALAGLWRGGVRWVDAFETVAAGSRIASFVQLAADATLTCAATADLSGSTGRVVATVALARSTYARLAAGAADSVTALGRAFVAWLTVRLVRVRADVVGAANSCLACLHRAVAAVHGLPAVIGHAPALTRAGGFLAVRSAATTSSADLATGATSVAIAAELASASAVRAWLAVGDWRVIAGVVPLARSVLAGLYRAVTAVHPLAAIVGHVATLASAGGFLAVRGAATIASADLSARATSVAVAAEVRPWAVRSWLIVGLVAVATGVVPLARPFLAELWRAGSAVDGRATTVGYRSAHSSRAGADGLTTIVAETDLGTGAAGAVAASRRRTTRAGAVRGVCRAALPSATGSGLADRRIRAIGRRCAADADTVLALHGSGTIVAWLTIRAIDEGTGATLAGVYLAGGLRWHGRTCAGVTAATLLACAFTAGLTLRTAVRGAIRAANAVGDTNIATRLESVAADALAVDA